MPRHASAARFDQGTKRVSCTEGTRTEILRRIDGWFKGENTEDDKALPVKGNAKGQIFWLDGQAGTGKSTISQTIANNFDKTDELGASFFCSRDDAECSNVNLIFPTIAYQLSTFNSTFKKHVSEAVRKDADVQYALASRQLQKLIVEPLEAVMREETFPPCIVIIDALDECKDEHAISSILSAISGFTNRVSPLKFFITSRPMPNVAQGFHDTGLMKDTSALILHSIPSDISEKDIRVYLQKRLSRIARSFSLPSSWPSEEDWRKLVEESRGLFIYAATAANFIGDRIAGNPKRQLAILMSDAHAMYNKVSPHWQLDMLYLQVLHEAFPSISGEQRTRLKTVQGTLALLFDPLDPESLDALLDLEESTVRLTLSNLHSIAIVPDAGGGPVQLIHPSFHDFIIDVDRCNDVNFVVNVQLQHTLLAEQALRVLQTLSPDMCKIEDPSLYNQEIVDLPLRIATRIPAHVQYACRHWASHLSSGGIHNTILDFLLSFCSNQLLNWLEVMSILGELEGAINALQSAHEAVKVRNIDFSARSVNRQIRFE